MDVEIPVLAGYLNVPTQTGFSLNRISKKVRKSLPNDFKYSYTDIFLNTISNAINVRNIKANFRNFAKCVLKQDTRHVSVCICVCLAASVCVCMCVSEYLSVPCACMCLGVRVCVCV